jgi:hypothetical protein
MTTPRKMSNAERWGRLGPPVRWGPDHDTIRPNLKTLSPASRRLVHEYIAALVRLEHPDE